LTMTMVRAMAHVLAAGLALMGCRDRDEGESDPRLARAEIPVDPNQLASLARAELTALNANSTTALVPNTHPRAIGIGDLTTLPYSSSRAWWVPIVIMPGSFRVPTEIGLRFTGATDDTGGISITDRPTRADLVTATQLALDGETRAVATATKALDQAEMLRPSPSWEHAIKGLRLDPRLPAERFTGEPSWSITFEPYDEASGGWTFVLLDARTFAVRALNGRRRR
jgi:hypothetical protein